MPIWLENPLEVEGWITEAVTSLRTNLAEVWEEMEHRLLKDYRKHSGIPYRPIHDPSIM
jgi:hypothetical protein